MVNTSILLLRSIRSLIRLGKVRVLRHAAQRMALRGFTLPEIEQILHNGFHESIRDEYDARFGVWTHAILGSTLDKRSARVVVAIVEELLVVIMVGPL